MKASALVNYHDARTKHALCMSGGASVLVPGTSVTRGDAVTMHEVPGTLVPYQVPGTTVCTRYQHLVLPDFASFVVSNADSTGLVFIPGKKQAMK